MEETITMIKNYIAEFGLNILAAIAILIIGKWIIKFIKRLFEKLFEQNKVEGTLAHFVTNLIYYFLLGFVVLAALGQVGIETTSLIAVLGAAGLAVGLALQGSLANFASGVLLIIFRPFKVDDFVDLSGTEGFVEKIHIFTTQIKTFDNKTIIIPNSMITGDKITNYTAKSERRVDMTFGISYGDDILKAKKILTEIINSSEKVLSSPAPFIGVSELGDSSVDFAVRPWVKPEDYWTVYFEVTEKVKLRFDQENITIPFPQRDVHIYNHNKE